MLTELLNVFFFLVAGNRIHFSLTKLKGKDSRKAPGKAHRVQEVAEKLREGQEVTSSDNFPQDRSWFGPCKFQAESLRPFGFQILGQESDCSSLVVCLTLGIVRYGWGSGLHITDLAPWVQPCIWTVPRKRSSLKAWQAPQPVATCLPSSG